jgi:hypothetical protein
MPLELESRMIEEMGNIGASAGKEIVRAQNFVAVPDQSIAQV